MLSPQINFQNKSAEEFSARLMSVVRREQYFIFIGRYLCGARRVIDCEADCHELSELWMLNMLLKNSANRGYIFFVMPAETQRFADCAGTGGQV